MKRLLILSVLIFSVLFNISAQEGSSPTMAVMDVVATNSSDVKAQVVYEYIVDVVNRANLYTLVERSALQAAIKEMKINSSGMIDDSTAAQIGKLVGAEFILISNLIVDDGITYLSTRIIAVQTGQVSNTAVLQAGDSENIASLTNRTISQLLDQPAGNNGYADNTIDTNLDESEDTENLKESETEKTASGDQKDSNLSLTAGITGIIPLLDDSEIFSIGFGLNVDFDFTFLHFGKGSLLLGAGSGVFFDAATAENGVLYSYNMLSIPLSINVKFKMELGALYIGAKIAGGGTLNLFMYTAAPPAGSETTVVSLTPAIFPGIFAGFKLSDTIGLELFGTWSMTFFNTYPYTAVNTGFAVNINL